MGYLWFSVLLLVCSVTPTGLELLSSGRPQIGISGVDYAFLGFLLPNPPLIPRAPWLLVAFVLLAWLVAGVLFPISPDNPPGNVSHFTGLALGVIAGLVYRGRTQRSRFGA
jgi:membrane associated rhomboid family serine protease